MMTQMESGESFPDEPKKKGKKGCFIVLVCVMVLAVILFAAKDHFIYAGAMAAYESCHYEMSTSLFGKVPGFKEADDYRNLSQYRLGESEFKNGEYDQAYKTFETLGDFEDSADRAKECCFQIGEEALNQSDYATAVNYFTKAENFDNAPERRREAVYELGHQLFLEEKYEAAMGWFAELDGEYPDGCYPHFMTLEEAGTYLTTQTSELSETINCYVAQVPEECLDADELWNVLKNYVFFQIGSVSYDLGDKRLQVDAAYYPGDKILQAWRSGDTSGLSEEEASVLALAEEVVSQAKAESSDSLALEIWLHDWLCRKITYSNPNMEVSNEEYMAIRELNCIGAMIDGTANCQGYTDAFYLLGNMAGFDVCRFSGTADGAPHTWNGIMLGNKMYFVDVTFDDIQNEADEEARIYIWFNCAYDTETRVIDGGAERYPLLATQQDWSVTYYGYKRCMFKTLEDAAISLLNQYRTNGAGWTYALVEGGPYDHDDFYSAVENNISYAGLSSVLWADYIEYRGGNTYLCVKWN